VSAWLAAAYAALALGLGWMLAGDRAWRWRAPYIVLAPAVAVALWLWRPNTAGWPTTARVPPHASLVWSVVREPDPSTSDRGRIYVWLDVGKDSPRAYSLPYSRALHKQVQGALNAVAHGRPVEVSGTVAGRHRPRSGRAGGRRATGGQRATLHFYSQPRLLLPPKTH
jgi:hypothetical protein